VTRREFIAAAAASGLMPASASAKPFPVHYARASPYDSLVRYVEPGTDGYQGEKPALELEARLAQDFARAGSGTARFYALPESQVRFEIANAGRDGLEYHTGVWQLPDRTVVTSDSVSSPKPYFRDVTSHVFGGTASFRQQLLKGNPYWRARLDAATGIDVDGNQGIAVGDIDNDGVDEVYVCQSGGLPNRLYKFHPGGAAEDITERAGLGILDETTCALFLDLRNSGWQDLVVLSRFGPLLFLNRGDGSFRESPGGFHFRKPAQGVFTGMAAADYDRDGRVDLYLCTYVYVQGEDQYQYPVPYHDARNGPPNFLFHNRLTQDGGMFEDVTEESGIGENNDRFSFAPAWCDFDGDGWPDLYVANDFGRNNLYRNREGHFRDEAAAAGVEDTGPGMSASWFDYDGDGRPDLYVSNMWSAAGQRVVRDPAFRPAAGGNEEAYRRHTKGNSLYRNSGDGTFEETGARERVEMGRWAWSSGGFDFDLDGVPEILIASGMVTNREPNKPGAPLRPDLDSFFWRHVVGNSPGAMGIVADYENGWNTLGQLFRGDYDWRGTEPNVFYVRRNGRYVDASGVSGLDFADDSRTFAVTDFDGDGYPDIVLKSRRGPQIRALQNDCAAGRPAIALQLRGMTSNRDAIGARVDVNGCMQFVNAGSGFLSQHSKCLHFGLAGRDLATVTITWPSGLVQRVDAMEPGYTYRITENAADRQRTPFRRREELSAAAVIADNSANFADTWLLEPVPTPEKCKGPGFVLIYEGTQPALSSRVPVDFIDLSRQKDDVAATWSLFHRYLFEFRNDLSVPLTLLIDGQSRARKVYANIPAEAVMRADLAQLDKSRSLALPFPGRYYLEPRRNYFKLGAAFYWAGYSERALPYLEEELRARPDRWNALMALGRIHQELGHLDEASEAFRRVLAIRPDYAPAMLSTGLILLRRNQRDSAREMFLETLRSDPQCADAANELGLLSAQSREFEDARKWFERAIQAVPGHAEAVNNLGVLYAQLREYPDALAAFRYGIRNNPDNEPLHLNMARICMIVGEREEARAVLIEFLDRQPASTPARRLLDELAVR
jgi:tetratricopeptide (TPR) repeat protein